MKKRTITKIGDIFAVPVSENKQKFFQLIAFDLTQFNSDVIRVFAEKYDVDENPEFSEVVTGDIQFYAHCVTRAGVKFGFWEKVGKCSNVGEIEHIIFRDTSDYGRMPGQEHVTVSQKWYIWRIGDSDFTRVGKLSGDNRRAEIGMVMSPAQIVRRIQTGKYDLPFYPGFE